jgi:hypothetical protein
VLIGTAQVAALLPGISRSGAAMVAGLTKGLSHADAARLSFLLATPVILARERSSWATSRGPWAMASDRRSSWAACCPAWAPTVGPLPDPLVRNPLDGAVRHLLPHRRAGLSGLVHAALST